jgi:exodeoxyribonuclease VII small subunit
MERIEQIAAQMEAGDLPLEQLVVTYEEGLQLVRFCGERLEAAEKRLETITRDAAGKPIGLEPAQGPAPGSDEIPPSTPPQSSDTEEDSSRAGDSPARLF